MVKRSGLLIILGSPATGKTGLASALAADLGIPCFSKDEFKETLFDSLGVGDREWSAALSRASFALLLRTAAAELGAGRPCLLEGNWRSEHEAALKAVGRGIESPFAQVCCHADAAEIERRFQGRQRHAGHLDRIMWSAIASTLTAEPRFLALAEPTWIYRGDAAGSYEQLRRDLEIWFEGRQIGTTSST
jgi:predicted kinase